jgi:hypothetical protein
MVEVVQPLLAERGFPLGSSALLLRLGKLHFEILELRPDSSELVRQKLRLLWQMVVTLSQRPQLRQHSLQLE